MTAPLLAGIEIGGTKLQIGVGPGDGQIVHMERRSVAPERGAEGVRGLVLDAFRSIPDPLRRRIAAAGVGFGGPVDAQRGRTTVSNQVSGWADFPLADWVRSALELPLVSIQNDADTAALGEARFGAGVGCSPVLYANSGSGIGGGLIVDGRIYRGSGQGAVEIGHLWLDDPGPDGSARARTLEQTASGWAIGTQAREVLEARLRDGVSEGILLDLCGHDPARVSAPLVAEAAGRGDRIAREVLDEAVRAMARGLAHAVTLLAPRRVILGGGVSLMPAALWIDPIREALDRLVFAPFRGQYDVVPAALGEEVVVQGALALASDAVNVSPAPSP
jgi:glucokinase